MRILFISHKFYPDIGGIEINSEILANAFVKSGHEVKLITWTTVVGDKQFPFSIIRAPGLFVLLREYKWADVIFENNPSLRLAWPSFFYNKPHVVALCTWINRVDGKIGWQDKLKFWWLKRASAVIAVSEAIREKCWKNSIVISNPYSNELFRKLPCIEKKIDFVFLGRLVSDKGAHIAIKAIAHLLKNEYECYRNNSKISLTIIGDGPELQSLKKMVIDMNIDGNVEFTGSLVGAELVKNLNKHRFILIPSVWEEPFGNVALEGMACGCVPIVSDGGGLLHAVGNAGVSFTRGNVNALVDCILKIINNSELENQLRNSAQSHLENHFPDIVSKRYLSVMENAIKSKHF